MEDSTQLFNQAVTLMLVGMGFVFVFLGFLILVIKTLIAPLAKLYPDPLPKKKPQALPALDSQIQSAAVVAAISAAVSQYRKSHP